MSSKMRDGSVPEVYDARTCPDERLLFRFLDGEMDARSQLEFLRHLGGCQSCREAVVRMAGFLAGLSDAMSLDSLSPEGAAQGASQSELQAVDDEVVARLRASGTIIPAPRIRLKQRALLLGGQVLRGAEDVASLVLRGVGKAAVWGARTASQRWGLAW